MQNQATQPATKSEFLLIVMLAIFTWLLAGIAWRFDENFRGMIADSVPAFAWWCGLFLQCALCLVAALKYGRRLISFYFACMLYFWLGFVAWEVHSLLSSSPAGVTVREKPH